MSEKITAMIEEIKGLTVLELSELVHALEEEFGVSAAAMAAPAAGGAAPAAEEKTEFDVVLVGFDAAQKIKVIKSVRDVIDLSGDKDELPHSQKALSKKERETAIAKLEKEMREASKRLEFEYAAVLRDRIIELRGHG